MSTHEVAEKLIVAIAIDNGISLKESSLFKDSMIGQYNMICSAIENFVVSNPGFVFTDENINEIATMEREEVKEKYGKYSRWETLDRILDEAFDKL